MNAETGIDYGMSFCVAAFGLGTSAGRWDPAFALLRTLAIKPRTCQPRSNQPNDTLLSDQEVALDVLHEAYVEEALNTYRALMPYTSTAVMIGAAVANLSSNCVTKMVAKLKARAIKYRKNWRVANSPGWKRFAKKVDR